MTSSQLADLNAASQRFLDAEALNVTAQGAARAAGLAADAAHLDATVTVPAHCRALQDTANKAYFKAQEDLQAAISVAQSAQAALSQAKLDLQSAINASLQTPVQEVP